MATETLIPIIIIVVIAAAVIYSRSKRKSGSSHHAGNDRDDQTTPTPNPAKPPVPPVAPPGQPQPPAPPAPPPESPDVLIDRNGKRPGDDGYDPRIDRPAQEFSPVEPQGAYYGEGPFDPDARWIGPDGPHWTDKDGNHHGPGS